MKKKILIFSLFLILAKLGFAQVNLTTKNEIVPTVQMLHGGMIQYSDTWHQRNLLLTATSNELILWNTQTGLSLRQIKSKQQINGAVFCNDGNEVALLIADGSEYVSLRFYSTLTGAKLKDSLLYFNQYGNTRYAEFLTGLVRNKNGNKLMCMGLDKIYTVDAIAKTNNSSFKKPLKDYPVGNGNLIFTDKDDEYFLVQSNQQHYIAYLIDKEGTIIKQTQAVKKRGVAVAMSSYGFHVLEDGGNLVTLNKDLSITDSIVQKKEIKFFSAPKFTTSTDGAKLVVALNNDCRVYDLDKKQWINKSLAFNCDVIPCSADASKIAFLYYSNAASTVIIVQTVSGQLTNDGGAFSNIVQLADIDFSSSGKIMGARTLGNFNGIDLQSGELLSRNYVIKKWLSDSLVLCISTSTNKNYEPVSELQVRNFFTDKITFTTTEKDNEIVDAAISADQQTLSYLTFSEKENDKIAYAKPRKLSLHVKTGQSLAKHQVVALELKSKNDSRLSISPNSRYISIGAPHKVKFYDLIANKWIVLQDTSSNEYLSLPLFFNHEGNKVTYKIDFTSIENGVTKFNYLLRTVDLEKNEIKSAFNLTDVVAAIAIHPTLNLYAIAYYEGLVEVRKIDGNELVFTTNTAYGLNALTFHPTQPWLAVIHDLTEVALINYGSGASPVKAYQLANDQKAGFGLITPKNYYMIPRANIGTMHFVNGYETYSFNQFDFRFNRPDIVLRALQSPDTALIRSYKNAYEKRIKKLGIDTNAFNTNQGVPQADFANRSQIAFDQQQGKLTLKVMAQDKTTPLDRLNIWVNDVPLYTAKGIDLKKKKRLRIDTLVTLNLSVGINKIETAVINANGIESYRIPLMVDHAPKEEPLVKLHFIGIGIDHFAQKDYNLQWSVKDIRDLAFSLKEKYGNNIEIDTLFDQNVTVKNIMALKAGLKQSHVDDKVILAYSGHGLLNKNYEYFLSTYGVDFNRPEINGLPYDSLEDLVDDIPARQKLMLLDACHSGEIDKDELAKITRAKAGLNANGIMSNANDMTSKGVIIKNIGQKGKLGMKNSFELMQSLFVNVSKGTGATIISAAGGMQYALEKNSLKNGVFTYCILDLMKTNETLGIKALKEEVNKGVVALTNGLQQPTSRSENNVVDWQVW